MFRLMMRLAAIRVLRAFSDGWLAVHAAVCAVPWWFALVLAVPPSTFASSPNSFRVFAQIAGEPTWSAICAAAGGLGLAAFVWRNWAFRLTASAVLAAWHGFVALALLAGNPHGTGSGTYMILAALATLGMLERARDDGAA